MRFSLRLSYFITALPRLASPLFPIPQFIYYIPLNLPSVLPLSLSLITYTPVNTGMAGRGVMGNEKRKRDWERCNSEMVEGETRKKGDIRDGRKGKGAGNRVEPPYTVYSPFTFYILSTIVPPTSIPLWSLYPLLSLTCYLHIVSLLYFFLPRYISCLPLVSLLHTCFLFILLSLSHHLPLVYLLSYYFK